MSWLDYVNKQLIATGSVRDALIAGDDGVVWAQSRGFEPKPEEVLRVIESLKDGGQSLAEDGIRVAGTRYIYLNGEPDRFFSCKRSTVGLYVRRTERVVVVALYEDPVTSRQCADCVINLCNYLATKGF
ncbi:profilin-like [Pollicipes pollicipes]|uniref:profilin-like n=1 Tax=Pollicipes pollicipes TaxID=41117 RepID=UPI001884AA2B|nr:profilin-like [Pollicipes pollicipes]